MVDVDGARQAEVRGDGAGILKIDSANDKACVSVTFKSDTLPLAERAGRAGRPRRYLSKPSACDALRRRRG